MSEGMDGARCAGAETRVAARSAATRVKLRVTIRLLSGKAEALLEMALDRRRDHSARQRVRDRGRDPGTVGVETGGPGLLDDARQALVVVTVLQVPGVHLGPELLEFLHEPFDGDRHEDSDVRRTSERIRECRDGG